MAQATDYNLANQSGASFRAELNTILAAVVSQNSGSTAPTTTYAYQLWIDTGASPNPLLKLRNGANSAWITIGDVTVANLGLALLASPTFTGTVTIPTATITTGVGIPLGTVSSPTIYFTGDTNTGIYSPAANQLSFTTDGTERLRLDDSGQIEAVSLGTAAAPTYTFNTDPNTGIYSPGADQVAISTNGTGRLFVDSTGQVGIGNAPGNRLHVFGGTSIDHTSVDALNLFRGGVKVGDIGGTSGGAAFSFRSSASTPHTFSIASSEVMRLDSSGRLGLGTSSPATLLHLSSATGSATPTPTEIRIATTTNAADWSLTDPWGRVSFYSSDVSDSGPKIVAAIDTVAAASSGGLAKLDFKLAEFSTGALTSRLTITPDSRVGIGDNAPDSTLTIKAATSVVPLRVSGPSSEFARIDTSGRLLVGTSTNTGGSLLQVNDNRIRVATAKTPASATDTGAQGEICWDANYLYVCTATNTWKRAALSTW